MNEIEKNNLNCNMKN